MAQFQLFLCNDSVYKIVGFYVHFLLLPSIIFFIYASAKMCDTENKTPYTTQEKVFVASLVEEHKDCLENKKTDASSLQAKARAWEEITNNFNANFRYRTAKQLRKLWDNLKHRTRKSDTDFKYKTLQTGGGPPPKEDDDPINEIVRNVVPTISLEVLNPFDSNELHKSEDKSNKSPLPKRSKIETTFQTKTKPKPSTSTYGTQQEKNEMKKKAIKDSINEEAQLRLQKLKEGIEQQAELHRLKMTVAEAEKEYWEQKAKLLSS